MYFSTHMRTTQSLSPLIDLVDEDQWLKKDLFQLQGLMKMLKHKGKLWPKGEISMYLAFIDFFFVFLFTK